MLTEATIDYLLAQVEAGAEAVMLFDSWAGVLSPSLFRAHVTAPAAAHRRRAAARLPWLAGNRLPASGRDHARRITLC